VSAPRISTSEPGLPHGLPALNVSAEDFNEDVLVFPEIGDAAAQIEAQITNK
jgi:SpoU rRNA methylase family enzyme